MKIDYSPGAQRDLLNIFTSINERNPSAAVSVVREIHHQVEGLAVLPFKGARTNVPDARRLAISRYPYFVFYKIEGDTVSVLHIRHTSRRRWRGDDE